MSKQEVWESIENRRGEFSKMAKDIWDRPELPLEEEYASSLQADFLEKAGFKVTRGIDILPTAIIAEYGTGTPVIGILGEYDALSGLSQAAEAKRNPVVDGAPGHGCGHNLLGTAGVGAAIAVKEAIDRGDISGTVRYYGCPAEEECIGKIVMLRDGCFDGCSVLLYWHPSSNNSPWRAPCLANTSAVFSFKGVSAHAPQAHLGRSALDAVELMDVGANYLREHLSRDVYLHYSILDNGIASNSVPDKCQVWYMMRAPKRALLDEAFGRLKEVARGAAIMTGTTLEKVEVMGGGNEVVCNQALADTFVRNMDEMGGPFFSAEDREYGKEIAKLFTGEEKARGAKAFAVPEEYLNLVLMDKVVPVAGSLTDAMPFSGDFDASWVVPFGAFNCATWPIGVFTHTWQATACTGSGVGMSGMINASKTLAGTVYDLMSDKALLEKVQTEFKETKTAKNLVYKPNITSDYVPRRVR
jgi:aminobenzoyl-glutamate utilization protein B